MLSKQCERFYYCLTEKYSNNAFNTYNAITTSCCSFSIFQHMLIQLLNVREAHCCFYCFIVYKILTAVIVIYKLSLELILRITKHFA